MKIIQVGLGAWGASWLNVVNQSAGWELAGVVDVNPAAAQSAADQYGVSAYRDIAHALENKESFDAVLVIVPPEYHAAVAVPALEAGVPTLIEKPLAHNLEDALAIIGAAETTGAIAMVSQNYRFKRAPRTVQRLIREGVIGDVQQVFINYQKNPPFEGFRLTMDEPLIVDAMIHHIDQMRGILGLDATAVRANSWNPSWSRFGGNASAVVQIEGANDVRVVYTGSWASQGEQTSWDGDWEIQGTKGSISWRNNTVEVRFESLFDTVFLAGATERSGVMHVDLDVLEVEERLGTLAAFAEAVETGTRPETDVRDNILSLQLVVATAESAKTDGELIRLVPVGDLLATNL
jgi:predicted dehydrogenase